MARKIDQIYYQAIGPRSVVQRVSFYARDRIYDDFIRICRPRPQETILDVGVSDVTNGPANVLERRYPYRGQLTAAGLGSEAEFAFAFPYITYRQIAPGEPLPFKDSQFDIATSNAVLEHVGSAENQRRFVAEMVRVSRRVYLTIPHRYFPVEHHTSIPFLHWNDRTFALACQIIRKTRWSRMEHLFLMSKNRLRAACPEDVEFGLAGGVSHSDRSVPTSLLIWRDVVRERAA